MNKPENNFSAEIAALKQQFDGIRSETENFIASAKKLSDRGVDDAKDMLESAKENWHSIKNAFESSTLAKFFSKGKKAAQKKPAAKAKPAKKAAKKAPAKKKPAAKKKK